MSIINVTISVEVNDVFLMNSDSELEPIDNLVQSISCIDGVEVLDYLKYNGTVDSNDPYSGYHGQEYLIGK